MNYFQRRRIRKTVNEFLRHARHLRNMREDLMREADVKKLCQAEAEVRNALIGTNIEALEKAGTGLYSCIDKLTPSRYHPAFRENFEILVVAIAVAMAFRAYFIQPFKIPTGSMQPTLYGIHIETPIVPSFMDRMPMKLVKWLCCGEWYTEIRVTAPGHLVDTQETRVKTPSYCVIGGKHYRIPRDARLNFSNNQYVTKGALLWSGIVTTGDHVFVDKVRWNFTQPKRGQVMVFRTDNIAGILQGTHYIKRLVGLPCEDIAIDPPKLIVDGKFPAYPEPIARIVRQDPGYEAGYTVPQGSDNVFRISLNKDEYFVLGDNTRNSKDSRYWGPVPRENTVGLAVLVYWPFSRRWGPIR